MHKQHKKKIKMNGLWMGAFVFLLLLAFGNREPISKKATAETINTTFSKAHSTDNATRDKMKIKIGASTFSATLYDNQTAIAFKALLPMTLNMVELNKNEKYVALAHGLPTHTSNPKTIRFGDLMLYGSSTRGLFYKTFSTSYSYTRLGRIDDSTGLVAAVGSGDVAVTFELP